MPLKLLEDAELVHTALINSGAAHVRPWQLLLARC
jgi:hypothetical protein